jgi:hypothetical protein
VSFAKIKRSIVPGKKSSIADKTLHPILAGQTDAKVCTESAG